MRKTTFLALAALSLLFTSCLNEPVENSYGDMYGGMDIYNAGLIQDMYSKAPLYIAFDLNMLLTDKINTGAQSLDDVKVTVGSSVVNVKDKLFEPETNITEVESGVYEIPFRQSRVLYRNSYNIDGIFVIDTKGKTLDELGVGEQWDISVKKNALSAMQFLIDNGGKIDYLSVDMSIARVDDIEWKVVIADAQLQYLAGGYAEKPEPSDWQSEYHVVRTGAGSTFSYSDLSKLELSSEGGGSGRVMYGSKMKSAITEKFTFAPSLRYEIPTLGTVRYELDRSVVIEDADLYPSRFVDVAYLKSSSGWSATMTYNGNRMVLQI